MICPDCQYAKTKVTETRDTGEEVIRVRQCPICRWRVTTSETYRAEQSFPDSLRNRRNPR